MLIARAMAVAVHGVGLCLAAGAGAIEPFSALYRVTPVDLSRSAFSDARGEMRIEWRRACDGWEIGERYELLLAGGRGASRMLQLLRAFERNRGSSAGSPFQFINRMTRDGVVVDQGSGAVTAARGQRVLTVDGAQPQLIGENVLFPVAYMDAVLRAAANRSRGFSSLLVDGADASVLRADSQIGPPIDLAAPAMAPVLADLNAALAEAAAVDPRAATALPDGPIYPTRTAFFAEFESQPSTVIERRMHAHGFPVAILNRLPGGMVLQADLIGLSRPRDPDCDDMSRAAR